MKALLLLYYWPPSGGPGVQRGVKLCRHLRDEGVEPTVVTVESAAYALPGEYEPDATLVADVPAGLRVVRTAHGFRRGTRALLHRTRTFRAAWHLSPGAWFERQSGWLRSATDALVREIETNRPDVLLTSSQPYTAHLAGRAAKLATGIPWVADFRDPWTFSWGRTWPSRRAFAWEDRREEEVLADADVVLLNTPGTLREMLVRRPWLDRRKLSVVRNGYDPEDFRVPPAPKPSGEFRIVHSGSFRARPPSAARRGLRSAIDRRSPEPLPYEVTTHSPAPLFAAVGALPDDLRRDVRIRLVGPLDPGWMRVARELGVAAHVESTGYRPHRESTADLLSADLLWLPTITRRDGGPVANVPAKTYEYLGSGRPVLALAGQGDVRDLVAPLPRCRVVAPSGEQVHQLADALAAMRRGDGPAAVEPDPEDARLYRRSETARGAAEALRAAARRSVGIGAVENVVVESASVDAASADDRAEFHRGGAPGEVGARATGGEDRFGAPT